ncbi:LytTR family transcriptional regulator DNA-binding domain-containing protein [Aquibacillus koreensis]|uniref:LytTR family transcriptional regulator DNA-binding domain-containing protein n=1 Tax=Aquibacillus koreensis TaxID=279446 RepID=A0A9X3WMW9_9BACI|nr:LytTR family transcriptional regulator DNA-binding domain-containing protein [Aquibacillus koreensis]MCT2537852.1 LytTR family transcriptional regulator DNA-binding domain-containing protein [Aquibacillus koreensis]MDC3421116.1 LytTR family transcriptional regulator DNA-binding domain-containing protein [Aquibacillus koreensis]
MSVLSLIDVEKHRQDSTVFPAIHLNIDGGEVIAIHSTTDIRNCLLNIFTGQEYISNGSVLVENELMRHGKISENQKVGFFFLDEGFYERLSVKDHLILFKGLFTSSLGVADALKLARLEMKKQTKIKQLSFSEKKRLQMAKLLTQDPNIFILEEPDQNVDIETKRIFIAITKYLKAQGKAILILTSNMESAITFSDHVYRLSEKGLFSVEMTSPLEKESQQQESVEEPEESVIHFNKIPAKVNDKLILFDPPEIDYVDSHDGHSNVHVQGESFPCVFTLNELEEKLQSFGFFRCHRSYIVNLQKVKEVVTWTRNSYSLILENATKTEIPLSKNKMADLKVMLGLK